jgi:hypothetical protein
MEREGGCACGAVRYVVTGGPLRVGLCHCLTCRKRHGAPFNAFAAFRTTRCGSRGARDLDRRRAWPDPRLPDLRLAAVLDRRGGGRRRDRDPPGRSGRHRPVHAAVRGLGQAPRALAAAAERAAICREPAGGDGDLGAVTRSSATPPSGPPGPPPEGADRGMPRKRTGPVRFRAVAGRAGSAAFAGMSNALSDTAGSAPPACPAPRPGRDRRCGSRTWGWRLPGRSSRPSCAGA